MPLTLNYNSITTGIINFLSRNSTTIDSGMYASLTTVKDFNPEQYNVYATQYPAISVDLKSHDEEEIDIALGQNSRREITCTWNIGCHIRTINSSTAVNQAMRLFVTNIETALRSDDRLSLTVNDANIISAIFGTPVRGKDGVWQKNGLIILETVHYVTG